MLNKKLDQSADKFGSVISEKTKARWQEIINGAVNVAHRLNDWERSFIDSVTIQIAEGRELTIKQTRVLYNLAERLGL